MEHRDYQTSHNIKQIDYDSIRKTAKEIIEGSRRIYRLIPKGERGRIEGGARNVEASVLLGTEERTDLSDSSGGQALIQERLLEDYTKLMNIYDNIQCPERTIYPSPMATPWVNECRTIIIRPERTAYNRNQFILGFQPAKSVYTFITQGVAIGLGYVRLSALMYRKILPIF